MIRNRFITNSSSSAFIFFTKERNITEKFLKSIGFTSLYDWETSNLIADAEFLADYLDKKSTTISPQTILDLLEHVSYFRNSLEEWEKEKKDPENWAKLKFIESEIRYLTEHIEETEKLIDILRYKYGYNWFEYEGGDNHGDTGQIGMSMDYGFKEGQVFFAEGAGGMIKISHH